MDTNKVIVTLLVLAIVLSVATVAFNAFSGDKTVQLVDTDDKATATVSLQVLGDAPKTSEGANVGLYVESGQ